jgi:RNA polymerase sigma-70 factor, ECF subfamily
LQDRFEFEQLVLQHQALVFRTLSRLVGSREQVEDLAQEVFLRFLKGVEHFRGDAKASTYLYRIILNVAQDEGRRRRRERNNASLSDVTEGWHDRLASPAPNAEQVLSLKQLRTLVNRGLEELSEMERSVLVLFHQEECTYEQISLILNLPLGTVRTHLHRGRKKLAERIKKGASLCAKAE